MRRLSLLLVAPLAVAVLVGCGDPEPSTKLAPEQKLPDVSKMSPEEVQKLHKNSSSDDRK